MYYYSHFWDIHDNGGSFFKPLFFEFPSDLIAYQEIEYNILLGDALKASILTVEPTDTKFSYYFPEGIWC
jgi:alpha-glucosidase (family GH31 glycosyl hydrolase)